MWSKTKIPISPRNRRRWQDREVRNASWRGRTSRACRCRCRYEGHVRRRIRSRAEGDRNRGPRLASAVERLAGEARPPGVRFRSYPGSAREDRGTVSDGGRLDRLVLRASHSDANLSASVGEACFTTPAWQGTWASFLSAAGITQTWPVTLNLRASAAAISDSAECKLAATVYVKGVKLGTHSPADSGSCSVRLP
jgi:hypothetical protein